MSVPFYDRKSFWDRAEISCIVVVGVVALGSLAGLPERARQIPPVAGVFGTVLIGVCRYRVKRIDAREKAEKADEAQALRLRCESQSSRMIKGIIDVLHSRYFRKVDKGNEYKHRVTLFVCVKSNPSGNIGKHLRIFARSGLYEGSTTVWGVDHDDVNKCRGIAAEIWFRNTLIRKEASCDWPDGDDPEAEAEYARSLGITPDEVRGVRIKSRYFVGTPVQVRKERWGVLLLDSTEPGHILQNDYQDRLLYQYATILGNALEGAES